MRECGDCTLCCTVTAVRELNKPERVDCVHCNKGCSIYEQRPVACAAFSCAWLDGDLPDWMRPDKVGVMIEKIPGVTSVMALAALGQENTWMNNTEVTEVLKEQYQFKGIAVITHNNQALIPEGRTVESVLNDLAYAARLTQVV